MNDDSRAPTPIFPDLLIDRIVDRLPPRERATIVIDGADAAEPVAFARRIRDRVRTGARACDVIDLHDFVRPASLRFEYSKTDELSYRTSWFDFDALRREVLTPLRPGGRGTYLPRLWDEKSDRSARAKLVDATADQVLVIAGPTALGRVPDAAVVVRLLLSESALRRRTPADEQWTVSPLLEFYAERGAGAGADFTVRWDHPERPALLPSDVPGPPT